MDHLKVWVLVFMGLFALSGCLTNVVGEKREPMLSGKDGSIPMSKVERMLESFADREVVLVSDACDAIERDCCKTAAERSLTRRLKSMNAVAVYDIVTSPNSLSHLVDLYVMINLQYLVWIKEDQALRFFGEKGRAHAASALGEAKEEISKIAEQAMKPENRARLDEKIVKWRQHSPEVKFVSMVRFGSLPDDSGKSPLEALSSLFEVLNPLDETSQTVEDAKKMAERMFYFGKRLPELVSWQTETAIDETLSDAEMGRLLEAISLTSASIDRISKTVETVPAVIAGERKEILAAWDAREAKLDATVKEVRGTVTEAKEVAVAANELAKSVELILKEVAKMGEASKNASPGEPSRPFNITEYSAAAVEMTKLAKEIKDTIDASHLLMESPVWQKRQEEINRLTDEAAGHAGRHGKEWVDHLVVRLTELLFVFFGLMLSYRWTSLRLRRRAAR